MTTKQMKQVQEQLPAGSRILRSYLAFEGDIRVIAKLPGGPPEARYTIKWEHETDYPRIKLMP